MTSHPRLFRRGATYYHRAAIPADIRGTYPKTEETFSLKTKDYQEAIRLVRIEAAKIDTLFDQHRYQLGLLDIPPALVIPPSSRSTAPSALQARTSVQPVSQAPLLSVIADEWMTEKSRTSWVPKTEKEHRVWMGHFLKVIGDKPISDYQKEDGRAFKAVLTRLPANWNKHESLKELPLDQASEMAQQLDMPPMSDSNVNKLMGFVGSFWTWAEPIYDECSPNPFKGLKVKIKKNVREERSPFTSDELNAIFSAPIFTGCQSERNWKEPGPVIPNHTGNYWVPLISLFSGARAGEIIQLYVDDIREQDGIPYFDLNDNGKDKTLKTSGSKRRVPIHPKLIDTGFLKHVEKQRKRGETRLFPEMKMGMDGYYSSPFSKHFRRFLKSINVKHDKNAFHSFRHCFEDACRESGISKDVMDALQGHVETGMSGRYGSGHSLKILNHNIMKIEYPLKPHHKHNI